MLAFLELNETFLNTLLKRMPLLLCSVLITDLKIVEKDYNSVDITLSIHTSQLLREKTSSL